MRRSGCSVCTEAWPQTKQIVEGTETIQLQHCKSKPQPCAQGSNPSSSFKSCLSWPGDGHDVFTAMQGATITHCGPISTTQGQITTRTAGERQTLVSFGKGRVA